MLVRIATGEYKYNTGKKVDHIADHRSTKWTRIKRQPTRDQFKEKQSKKKRKNTQYIESNEKKHLSTCTAHTNKYVYY